MSTLNFPTSPSLNDTYSFGTKTWIWNGDAWQLNSTGAINGIPIGNTSPSTGAFTTLSATGNITGNYFIGNGSMLTGISGGGGASWTAANTAPVSPSPGAWWYNTTNNAIYLYVNDGDSNQWVDQSFPTVFQTVTTGSIINSNANGVGNIGTDAGRFDTVFAKASSAQYADLAEIYSADKTYSPGTVVVFGGDQEVTASTHLCDTRVAGVVSTKPAYIMNADAEGVAVALTGRVPCQVRGPVAKGDLLITSDLLGTAQKIGAAWAPGCVIGKSLQNIKDDSVQLIEIAVGRF
jgi:hypothetical protein